MASKGNETESCSEEDDSDDDAMSMVSGSSARSQAKSTQSNVYLNYTYYIIVLKDAYGC